MKSIDVSQPVTVEMVPAVTGSRRRVGRSFYIGAALFVILLNVVGFGPSIIDQSRRNASLTPLVMAHGIAAGAWLLLFLAQATLVQTSFRKLEKRG
jgi:hypothetical protein